LDKKFNEESKIVFEKVIWWAQVGFENHFVTDCFFNRHLCSSNFEGAFLPDCTDFVPCFLGYEIRNLMRILKLGLKK